MLSIISLTSKLSDAGYRRTAYPRTISDNEGNPIKVYDFEHRRSYDMFSAYLDENDNVLFIEFTKIDFDKTTRKFSQKVTKIDNDKMLNMYLR